MAFLILCALIGLAKWSSRTPGQKRKDSRQIIAEYTEANKRRWESRRR